MELSRFVYTSLTDDTLVHFSEVPRSIAALSFHYPHIFNVLDAILFGSVIPSKLKESGAIQDKVMQLNLVKIPSQHQNQKYSALLRSFIQEHGFLCIGLFRSKSQHRAPIPYVFLNPASDTIIVEDDHVFIFAPVQADKPGQVESMKDKSCMNVVTSLYNTRIPNLSSSLQNVRADRSGVIQVRRRQSEMGRTRQRSKVVRDRRSSSNVLLKGLESHAATQESSPMSKR
jgi:hypothetical protein